MHEALKQQIDAAWQTYRREAARISSNRRIPWTDYLKEDDRLWRKYLDDERQIRAAVATYSASTQER